MMNKIALLLFLSIATNLIAQEETYNFEINKQRVLISGAEKNNKWQGNISFTNTLNGKNTTCTYEDGKPINGVVMVDDFVTTYKNGKKNGLETTLTADSFFGKTYDSIAQNYTNSVLDGKISYYKKGVLVGSGELKDNQGYQGSVYTGQYQIRDYKNGALVRTVDLFRNNNYKHVKQFAENTEEKDGEEILYLNNKVIAKGKFKNALPFEGKFGVFSEEDYPKSIAFDSYENGKKNGESVVFDILDEKVIMSNTYKKDVLVRKTWPYAFKNNTTQVGNYKDGAPYSGQFYDKDDILEMVFTYEKGIKKGTQYYAAKGSHMTNLLDSINYVKGKPFNGGELEMKAGKMLQHIYTKGKLIKTNSYSWGMSKVPDKEVVYTKKGYVVNNFIGQAGVQKTKDNVRAQKALEVVFSDKKHTSGVVTYYLKNKEVGLISFKNSELTSVDIVYAGVGPVYKIHQKKTGQIVVEINYQNELIAFHPNKKNRVKPTYDYFIDLPVNLIDSDGTMYFYLDNTEKPYAQCVFKNQDPYTGIILHRLDDNSYKMSEYENGEVIQEAESLTKAELLEALNK